MAARFLQLGAEVHICGRRKIVCDETATELMGEYGGSVVSHGVDIRNAMAVDEMIEQIWASGPLTDLINNAAGNFISRSEDLSPRGFDAVANIVMHGTFYVNSSAVDDGEPGVMTWAELRTLRDLGHDIGGHSTDHVDLLSSSTTFDFKWDQVCDDRARLFAEGFNPVSFAFPFGSMNDDTSALARACGYQSARKAGTVTSDGPIYSETIPPTENPWAIRILGTEYNGPVTLAALQLAVNQARSHGGSWLPTLFHEICYSGTSGFNSCMNGYLPVSDTTIDQFLA